MTWSNYLTVSFKDAPVCSSDQLQVVGAVKHETLILKCDVDSSPPATSYLWTFKATGHTSQLNTYVKPTNEVRKRTNVLDDIKNMRLYPQTNLPRLDYTPTSDIDYGTVSCWARNAVDVQASPCVFRIVAASRPFPLQNCTLANHTPDSLEVNCKEGYDGGFSQTFILEVVVLPSLRLERNMSLMVSVIHYFPWVPSTVSESFNQYFILSNHQLSFGCQTWRETRHIEYYCSQWIKKDGQSQQFLIICALKKVLSTKVVVLKHLFVRIFILAFNLYFPEQSTIRKGTCRPFSWLWRWPLQHCSLSDALCWWSFINEHKSTSKYYRNYYI